MDMTLSIDVDEAPDGCVMGCSNDATRVAAPISELGSIGILDSTENHRNIGTTEK